jgi:branched-chain amino acid transport system substrate-binding protein
MSRPENIILGVIALASLALAISACETEQQLPACSDGIGCIDIAPKEPVRIGILQAVSGKVAPLGWDQIRGIELAVDSRGGKILGHSIALQMEDTGCTAEGGANAALKIIANPQTVAILGTTCSAAAATASKAMSDAGLVMVSGNNSAPFLTSIHGERAPNWQPGYFRTTSNEEYSGKAAALYAFSGLGLRKAATVNDGDIYTKGLTGGFEQEFQRLGGEIVLSTSVAKGEKEMGPVLQAVLNTGAQILFFPLFQPEGNYIVFQAASTPGFENIALMSDGALIESSFIESVKEKGKGLYFVGPTRPSGPLVDALVKEYISRYNTPPPTSYFLNAYDAACLLLDAIQKVAVRSQDGSLRIGRQALRSIFYATVGFKGVSGDLTCNEFGDCASPAFNVLRLDDPNGGVEGLQSNIVYTYAPGNGTSSNDTP